MKIILLKKSVYGRDVFYPVCDKAKIIASMFGTKTIPDRVIDKIRQLGFDIEITRD